MGNKFVKTVQKGQVSKGFKPKLKVEKAEQDSLMDKLETELNEQGIKLFDNENVEEEYLSLPADITEIESKELGKYFSMFTKQKCYVRSMIGRMRAMVREKNEELNMIRNVTYATLPAKSSVTEKELKLRGDDGAVELINSITFMDEKLKLLSDYLDSLIDIIFLVSREVSRREADFNDELREGSMNNKRRR